MKFVIIKMGVYYWVNSVLNFKIYSLILDINKFMQNIVFCYKIILK